MTWKTSLKISGLLLAAFAEIAHADVRAEVHADEQNASQANTERLASFETDQAQGEFFENFNYSTFALQLLQVKNKFKPVDFVLGGSAEADLQHWHGDKIEIFPAGTPYQDGYAGYFTNATIDVLLTMNPWAAGFFSVSEYYIGSNNPNSNYIFIPHAFLLFGNLDDVPVFATAGINYVPFGVFDGSGPWDIPLTSAYFFPAQAPQISLGFNKYGVTANITSFQNQSNYDINFAYSVYYNQSFDKLSYSVGAGYLSDLPINGNNSSYNRPDNRSKLKNLDLGNFGAIWDFNGSVTYGQFVFTAEYDRGTSSVITNDYKPEAYAFTANYTVPVTSYNITFGSSYSSAMHLNDVPIPLPGNDTLDSTLRGLRYLWSVNATCPVTKNIVLGLDWEKATTNFATITDGRANTYTTTLDVTAYF